MYHLIGFYIVASASVWIAEACSTRSTPKPRTPVTTVRPNITFQTYQCPPAYAAWYCLNGATCFTVKIGESILYNCECASGYMGQRCEYKDLDESYPLQERVMIETASIAGGVTVAVLISVIVSIGICIYIRRRKKKLEDEKPTAESPAKPFVRLKSSHLLHTLTDARLNTPEIDFSPQPGIYQDLSRKESPL